MFISCHVTGERALGLPEARWLAAGPLRAGSWTGIRASWAPGKGPLQALQVRERLRRREGPGGSTACAFAALSLPSCPSDAPEQTRKYATVRNCAACARVSHVHPAHTAPSQPAVPGTSWGTLCPQAGRATSCSREGTSVGGAALSLYIPPLEHASQTTKSLFPGWPSKTFRAGTQPYPALSLVSIYSPILPSIHPSRKHLLSTSHKHWRQDKEQSRQTFLPLGNSHSSKCRQNR